MNAKEFQKLSSGDRVRLGGRKGTAHRVYHGWGRVHVEFDNGTTELVEHEHLDLLEVPKPEPAVNYDEALKGINHYRHSKGRRALDPVAAGWSAHDVIVEYWRLVDAGSIKLGS